jgi:peroxiredoxin
MLTRVLALVLIAHMAQEPKIEKGEKAPDFTAKNQKDEDVKLSELLEAKRNVLLAFYPKDFTGG